MPLTTLHIGTTKTGSSSIQKFLAENRKALRKQGILYPVALGKVPHNVIPAVTIGRFAATQHQTRYQLCSEQDYRAFATGRREQLAAEIAKKDPEHIIISSEHMHSRCHTKAHFQHLKRLIAPALEGRDLQIIVYLRPQIEHAISLYSTMLSHGLTEDIDTFVRARMTGSKRRYHDFQELLTTWQLTFPNASLKVRAFNTAKSLPEGVISDFMDLVRIQAGPELTYPHRVNTGLNLWSAEAMRVFNSMNLSLNTRAKKRVKTWIRQQSAEGKPLPSLSLSHKFQESFKATNQWVLQTHLPQTPSALSPNWERLATSTPPPHISETELRAVFDSLIATLEP